MKPSRCSRLEKSNRGDRSGRAGALLGLFFLLGAGLPAAAAAEPAAPAFEPAPASPVLVFSKAPTAAEISRALVFEEPLVPMGGQPTDAAQNRALADALSAYERARLAAGPSAASEVDPGAFERFLAAYPSSPWRVSLQTNLGVEYYRRGEFSKALNAWRQAWAGGKDEKDPAAVALVDRALGELARMEARLGRVDELKALFAEAGDRQVKGLGASAYYGARGGLESMEQRPQVAFKCGPWALDNILSFANPAHPYRAKLNAYASTAQGVSLASVAALAKEMKMDLIPAQRTGSGLSVPTPAVIHWKLGHYGALLRYENGRYLLQDPTFGNSQWVTQAVLDEEASGYFLVAGQTLKTAGWQPVSDTQAQKVWGRGDPQRYPPPSIPPQPGDPPDGPPCDSCPCSPGHGMAAWRIRLSEVDLAIVDTPLFYQPPVGPSINFQVSYEQRDANQPATFAFANLGYQWNFNWITTLTFDSNNAYINSGDSGQDVFAGFTSSSTSSGVSDLTRTRLVKTGTTGYQLIAPDGGMKVFGVVDGSGRYYMTQVVDALGNAVTLAYDKHYRLITITDAIGQVSTLAYGSSDVLKITQITDPFKRTASFTYNSADQLSQITDANGLTSKFTYVSSSNTINALTTGYGTTQFTSTESGLNRTLLVTFPDGTQEMAQSLGGSTAGIADSDPASIVPQGIPVFNAYLSARNTSYWDRKAMIEAPGDPTKARNYHYLHSNDLGKGPILESLKLPDESRTWYYYQGQEQPGFINTDGQNMINRPSYVARVLDDGTTQLYRYSYNALGNRAQAIDPVGRTTNYIYAANNIDLLEVRQVTGVKSYEVVSSFTYNARHQVLTATDAAGQVTTYTYNAAGQPLTVTNPAHQTTTWSYSSKGYVQSVSGPLAGSTGSTAYTYDALGRVATTTDALGDKVSYTLDNLNRVTAITYPDNSKDQFTYTLLNVSLYTDRLNRQTTYAYNKLDQLSAVTDPLGRVTRFDYCRCGGLSSVTDPLGNTTRFDYDIESRPVSRTYSDGSQTTYAYETNGGRLKSETDAKGQTTQYVSNADNTLARTAYPNAKIVTPTVSFAYDPIYPRIAAMTDGTGTTTYTYNPVTGSSAPGAGQIAAARSPFGTISYGYNVLGRVVSRVVGGSAETVAYNTLGMPTEEINALGAATYGYLGNSRQLSSITLPNKVTGALTYQPPAGNSWLKEILYQYPDKSTLSLWGYVFNAGSQITSWTQQRDSNAASVLTLGYDNANRLTSVTATNPAAVYTYTYDTADNRLTEKINSATTVAIYNSLNELSNAVPPPESDRTYEWNGADQLTAINYTGTTKRTEFTYDGRGRWVQIVEKTGSTVNATRRFLWDGGAIRLESDATGATVKRFFAAGVQLVGGSTPGSYYYTRDHLGSIRELTDASAKLRARYNYDPYGRRSKTSGDLDTDLGFGGLFEHTPSGLALALLRAYDPNVGRWVNRDPIREGGGLNLYAYVADNPVNFTDFGGLNFGGTNTGGTGGFTGTNGNGNGNNNSNIPSTPIPPGQYVDIPPNGNFTTGVGPMRTNDSNQTMREYSNPDGTYGGETPVPPKPDPTPAPSPEPNPSPEPSPNPSPNPSPSPSPSPTPPCDSGF